MKNANAISIIAPLTEEQQAVADSIGQRRKTVAKAVVVIMILLAGFGYLHNRKPAALAQKPAKESLAAPQETKLRKAYEYGRLAQFAADADSMRRMQVEIENLRSTNEYLTQAFELTAKN